MKSHWFKKKLMDFLYKLIPIGELALLAGGAIGYLMILAIIVLNGSKLKLFFVPVLILYILPIFIVKYLISKRDDRNQIRALGGDELFEKLYPKEAKKIAKKAERIAEKNKRKLEKEKLKEEKRISPEL